jgi:hypothetical protein
MAKAVAFVGGMACGFLLATGILVSHADDVSAEVNEAAVLAHVSPVDLAGAVNSTGVDPYTYLRSTGELPPVALSGSPLGKVDSLPTRAVDPRVACLERKESGGANVWNARGSGAGGVMQYLPSTFARGAAELGHPEWSLWNPAQARAVAAHDLAVGRRSQWTVGGC